MKHSNRRFAGSWQSVLLGILLFTVAAPPTTAIPTLHWSTYLGGSRNDVGTAVAVWQGNTYVAGTTFSADFPVTGSSSKPGNDETTSDAFVTALDPSGAPIYSTYVQLGENTAWVYGITIGPDGSAYVLGTAYYQEGGSAAVVARLDPRGHVVWTREVRGGVQGLKIAADGLGNVYVLGYDNTDSAGLLFVWRLGPDGSTHYRLDFDLHAWTLSDIAADAFGNAYLSGSTELPLPASNEAAPDSLNGFVMKISPAGSILWSAYLGGSMVDAAGDLEVAPDGSVVVTGGTGSFDFPTLNALQPEPSRINSDGFLVRLSPSGAPLSSTYLHLSYVVDLEVTASAIYMFIADSERNSSFRPLVDSSCGDNFLVTLDANASQVLDATCLGHFAGDSYFSDLAADSTGIYVTGPAPSNLTVQNAWQPAPAGEGDAFAAKLVLNSAPDCSAAVASPASLWPADGKLVSVFVRGVSDPNGDAVTLSLTSIFQDEWPTVSGTPDATGLGTNRAKLRASRLNGGNGRVYHLRFRATDPRGSFCTGLVKVCVPVTQGGTCVDGGARVDSTRAW